MNPGDGPPAAGNPSSSTAGAAAASKWVLRPSCIVCVSDCDADAIFTSCHHFVCSRCVAKYPGGSCPRCRQPCRYVRVGSSALVTERLQTDPLRLLQCATAALDFQHRQEQFTHARLKELVTMFNSQHR